MLLTTIDQLKEVVPTIIDDDFTIYKTYIDEAELYLKNEILGATLYSSIETNKAATSYASLVSYCRSIIALKGFHTAIPFLDLVQTSSGFAVTNTNNQAPASRDRVKALRDGVLMRMNESIEVLLRYMDALPDPVVPEEEPEGEPVPDVSSEKAQWKLSPSYTTRYDLLIISARDFQKFVNINESHRMYGILVPIMAYVEDLHVNPSVSKDLLDDIKTKIKAGTSLGASYTAIYTDLKRAEANLALSVAIERLAVQVDPDGVKLNYSMGESSYSDKPRNKELADNYLRQGLFYLNKALQYILNHLTDFSKYTESDIYVDQTAGYKGYENATDDAIYFGG